MLYEAHTKTLIETNLMQELSDAKLAKLAKLKGTTTKKGEEVEMVAILFLVPEDAEKNLPRLKQMGLECRIPDGNTQKIIYPGARMTTGTKPEGPLLPVLREAAWPHVSTAVHRPLFAGPIGGPWLTFGWDGPKMLARMAPTDLGERTIADVEKEALANLAQRRAKAKLGRIANGATLTLSEEYGAEMILLPSVMREIAAELGTKLVVVGVPCEHGFFATSGTSNEVATLIAWTRDEFDKTPKRRISPLPFLVDDGALVGIAGPARGGDPAKKKWWQFW